VIIATRTLKFRNGSGDVEIRIDIFSPERDGNAWKCSYEIGWPHGKWSSYAAGLDSVQAILLALHKIGVEIYFSDYHETGKLFWCAPGTGYGFPVPSSARDVMIGDDLKYY
jgi:hypothetical protein